jgi:hypothetical protein
MNSVHVFLQQHIILHEKPHKYEMNLLLKLWINHDYNCSNWE